MLISDGADTSPSSAAAFLRDVFDSRGPVDEAELHELAVARELAVAAEAVRLIAADICTTTALPTRGIEVRLEDGAFVLDYYGSRRGVMTSLELAQTVCDIADIVQDEVIEDVGAVWPICPTRDGGLAPELVDGMASWVCPTGGHVAAVIGRLRS